MSSSIRSLVRPVLNQLRTINKIPIFETFLATKTQGKDTSNLWVKFLPPLELYKPGSLRRVTRNGINYELDISDYLQYILYFGINAESREALYNLVQDGMYILDIGTNIGDTILNIAKLNPNGQNFGFEPVPLIFEKARKNISLNNLDNITLHNIALSDAEGSLFFEIPKHRNLGGISMSDTRSLQSTEVRAYTLDKFVEDNNLKQVDLIKIDVEGFEGRVLKGAYNTIIRFKPILFLEVIDSYLKKNGSSAKDLIYSIEAMGYRVKDSETSTELRPDALTKTKYDIVCIPLA